MLMQDPSVWAPNFPGESETFMSDSFCQVVMNLIRGFKSGLLLAFSLAICAIVPKLVTLAIYLALAISWSTVLSWVANTLHQFFSISQPWHLLPQCGWLFSLSLWPPTSLLQLAKEQNKPFR
jgi:hypothetical protein